MYCYLGMLPDNFGNLATCMTFGPIELFLTAHIAIHCRLVGFFTMSWTQQYYVMNSTILCHELPRFRSFTRSSKSTVRWWMGQSVWVCLTHGPLKHVLMLKKPVRLGCITSSYHGVTSQRFWFRQTVRQLTAAFFSGGEWYHWWRQRAAAETFGEIKTFG